MNGPLAVSVNGLYCKTRVRRINPAPLQTNLSMKQTTTTHFQMGDNPGRKEPTTGEINYRNVFRHIHGKGFAGVMGMEHGLSKRGKEGEQALIAAYQACDDF